VPETPTEKAPARKAVKRAVPAKTPARKTATKTATKTAGTTGAPAGAPPLTPARPVKRTAPRRPAAPAAPPPAEPWPAARPSPAPPPKPRRPAAVPPLPASAPPPAQPPPPAAPLPVFTDPTMVYRPRDGVLRALVALTVLLLAAAAGLGTAALVEHRDTSYRTTAVVRIGPGFQPTQPTGLLIGLGVRKYAELAATHAFTADAAKRAATHATGDVTTAPLSADEIVLTVASDTAKHARALAAGAGDALVEAVNLTEAVDQPSAGDRLLANVETSPAAVSRHAPDSTRVWLLGLAAAAGVLVLGGAAALLRRR